MRIIGGKFRGRPIIAPKGSVARPTADRTRESLFNILSTRDDFDFEGARVIKGMIAYYRYVLGCTLDHEQKALGLYHLRAGSALIDLVALDGPLGAFVYRSGCRRATTLCSCRWRWVGKLLPLPPMNRD